MQIRFLKRPFIRNVVTLSIGTALAQAIPVLLSPVLTRLYSPENFGLYALFIAITTILSSMSTGRYELAVMLPKRDKYSVVVIQICILISLLVSLFASIFVFTFADAISSMLENFAVKKWLYFVPIMLLLIGLNQSLRIWFSRKRLFSGLAKASVAQSLVNVTTSILLGGIYSGGLIIGFAAGVIVSLVYLLWNFEGSYRKAILHIDVQKMLIVAKRHRKFPQYDMPTAMVYSFYSNAAVILIGKLFESSLVGFYLFAHRLIQLPFNFLISSFSEVFYKRLSSHESIKLISDDVNRVSLKILIILGPIFLLFTYTSKIYCGFIFGNEWESLHVYICLVSAPVFVGVLLAPYKHVLRTLNKQELSIKIHVMRLIAVLFSFLVQLYLNLDFVQFLYLYTCLEVASHLLAGFLVDRAIGNDSLLKINAVRVSSSLAVLTLNALYINYL